MCKKYNVNNKCKDLKYCPESRWITEKELLKEKRFKHYLFHKLKKCKEDGVVINSYIKRNKRHVNMYRPHNALVISNETKFSQKQNYINSTIQILSSCASRPSFLILDTMGDYYCKNVRWLTEKGYNIKVIDLNNPHATIRWNPMGNAFNSYYMAHNLQNQVEFFNGINPIKTKYKPIEKEYDGEWYGFDEYAYKDKALLENAINDKKIRLLSVVEKELRQIATAICPILNKQEPTWEHIASEFIFGVMLTMLKNAMSGEQGMSREKFNLYNLTKICLNYDCSTLENYFANTITDSRISSLVSPILNASNVDRLAYMGIIKRALSVFLDKNMCFATSENELDLDDLYYKPTALFIKMPHIDCEYLKIAIMSIYQLYLKYITKINHVDALKETRNVYLLLDNFEKLPMIDGLDVCVTIGRSRKVVPIFFVPSYECIYDIYGQEIGKNIVFNCNIHIYFGSDATRTREDFSSLCGDIRYNNQDRPFIYPNELEYNNNGIIKILREFPIRAKFD